MENIEKYYRKTGLISETLGLSAFSDSTRTSCILMTGSVKLGTLVVTLLYTELCKHTHPGIIYVLAHHNLTL